ncbi:hypothetical protein ASPACDRAFT_1890753 [Aspergillus aculeatus ATCC 16872]|uniref:Uncharacterized protein n=1 Tax=Aspergillus aculeatus (strain ATCC 16872 / CBS 172.66 / WB 5094) TaxID=690307 RepID=A0A1L9WL76_ASPA1|nr:uncharacterized protein ASPACDRAFT_1890753 [Aspergillus aculeatus ATCC 16872]OJJ96914.1 hypothetical protein ASPACDRAFT_1890753 [Aspergillus aculeatus ATCC 16872]
MSNCDEWSVTKHKQGLRWAMRTQRTLVWKPTKIWQKNFSRESGPQQISGLYALIYVASTTDQDQGADAVGISGVDLQEDGSGGILHHVEMSALRKRDFWVFIELVTGPRIYGVTLRICEEPSYYGREDEDLEEQELRLLPTRLHLFLLNLAGFERDTP